MIQTKDSQGQLAAKSGAAFEKIFKRELIRAGGVEVSLNDFSHYQSSPRQAPSRLIFARNVPYQSTRKKGFSEFMLGIRSAREVPEFSVEPRGAITPIRGECKYQRSQGSVEDKINTNMTRLFNVQSESRSLFVVDIPGVRPECVMEMIDHAQDLMLSGVKGGSEIAIMHVDFAISLIRQMMGTKPVDMERPALNYRDVRDGLVKASLLTEDYALHCVQPEVIIHRKCDAYPEEPQAVAAPPRRVKPAQMEFAFA